MLRRNSEGPYSPPLVPIDNGPPEPAGGGRRALDLREIAQILRRHLQLIFVVPLALGGIALLFVNIVTPLYTATATVLIDPRHANVTGASEPVLPNLGTDDSTIESQVLLIQSIGVLQRVAEELKLTQDAEFTRHPGILDRIKRLFSQGGPAPSASPEEIAKTDAVEALQKRLKVIRQRTTFLVDINASSIDPTKATKIANAIASAFLLEQVRSKFDSTKIANDWLNRQLDELRGRVVASDKAVEDFRAANNLTVSQGVTLNDQQLTDLNSKLVEARVATAEARAKYDQVQQVAKNGSDPGSLSEALSSDTISHLRTQYADLAKTDADMSAKYGPQHPSVGNARAQMRDTQRLINDEIKRILQGRRHAYEVAAAREDSLKKTLDGLQGTSSESGQAQIRLRELQREAEANRTLYESFLARYKETSAQESLEMPDSRIVTRAEIPLRPSFPKTTLFIGLALLLGFAIGAVLALVVDFFDRRVKTQEQVEAATGLPAIAAMPLIGLRELARLTKRGRKELDNYTPKTTRLLPSALQPPLMRYAIEEPTSIFAEAVRAIRLAVLRAAKLNAAKIVMVTSSLDSEGKTTLATNLAHSLAAIGVRTLLVEGDLRNPELTRSFCPHAGLGLFDVATDRVSLQEAILVEPDTNLAILPCPLPDDAKALTEFVFSDGMGAIFTELRRHYEIIVVDAPPLMPLVDSLALAEYADCILFAIGWNRTPQHIVARSMELLSPVYDRILGAVLTQVDLRRLRFYDHSYNGRYMTPYVYGLGATREMAPS